MRGLRTVPGACGGAAWNDAIGISSTNMLVSLKKRSAAIGESVVTAFQTRSAVSGSRHFCQIFAIWI
jgi:hypothetical protein